MYFRDKNNDLIVLKDPCGSAGLLKQAAGRAPTRADVHGAFIYVKMFCVAMIEETEKKHFIKCLITSLDSDSVHDSKLIRMFHM